MPDGKAAVAAENTTDKRLLLGIDLGTSRTAIISNRNHKHLIPSVVGYPKDLIGLKLLGVPYCVGDKAVEMGSALDLFHPLENGVLREYVDRDLEVARHLMSYAIQQAAVNSNDKICAIIGVPARASAANKDFLLNIARESVDMALVISEPFMVAYGQNRLNKAIVIDIGAGTIDICALKGAMPGADDQFTIAKAGNFVDEQLKSLIAETYPDVQINTLGACAIKERHSYVGAADGKIRVKLRSGGKPVTYDVTEEVRRACESLMPDVIECTETLIQGFQPEDQEAVLRNIVIAGGGSQIRGIDTYVAEKLSDYGKVKVTCVDDPNFSGATGGLRLAQDLPPQYWGELGEFISN